MSSSSTESPFSSAGLDAIRGRIRVENGRASADYASLRLGSHFQPIFSVAHSRIVGYEALMRAQDSQGKPVPPLEVFGRSSDFFSTLMLDRLSGTVHVQNFQSQSQNQNQTDGWLFLNVNVQGFPGKHEPGRFLRRIAQGDRLSGPSHCHRGPRTGRDGRGAPGRGCAILPQQGIPDRAG